MMESYFGFFLGGGGGGDRRNRLGCYNTTHHRSKINICFAD
jgi:hypothetical protein